MKRERSRAGGDRNAPRGRGRRGPAGRASDDGADAELVLHGLHTVAAALANPARDVKRIVLTRNAAQRLDVPERLADRIEIVEPRAVDALAGRDAVHQGAAAVVAPLPGTTLRDIPLGDLVLVADQVTDPHNLGAILRSAAALGAAAVVTTRRNAPGESGVLAKAASGALEHVPLIRVGNLAAVLGELRRIGFATVGLDSEGEAPLEDALPPGPLALVLGAEGRGLRERTRDTVDVLARLDMPGPIRSLNVSNAAALALYVARRALDAGRISAAKDG